MKRSLTLCTWLILLSSLFIQPLAVAADRIIDARLGARFLDDSRIVSGLTPGQPYSVSVSGTTNAPMQGLFFMYVEAGKGKACFVAIGDSFSFRPINGFYQIAPVYLDWSDSSDNTGTLVATFRGPTTVTRMVNTRTDVIMVRDLITGLNPADTAAVTVEENPEVTGMAVKGLFFMCQKNNSQFGFYYVPPDSGFTFRPIAGTFQLGAVFLDWSTVVDNNGILRIHTQRQAGVGKTLNAFSDARLLQDSRVVSGLTPGALYSVSVSGTTTAPMHGVFCMYVESGLGKGRYVAINDSFSFRPTNGFYQLAPIYVDWIDSADNVGTLTLTIRGPTTVQRQINTRTDVIMLKSLLSGLPGSQASVVSISEQPPIQGYATRGLFVMYQRNTSEFGFNYLEPGQAVRFTPINGSPQIAFLFADWSTIGDNTGIFGIHWDVISGVSGIKLPPAAISLLQNFPNPWNPSTTIRYAIPRSSFVTLTVFDALGQQVARLVSEPQEAGDYNAEFRGEGLASGVYYYRLTAGGFVQTRSMLFLK